jgi:diaminobutyrate-2-oxoglutarate transaminase
MDTSNDCYVASQTKFESNARTYPRNLPIAITKADGLYVFDADGHRYMDCLCGAGTLALGHNHPVQVAAIREHLDAGRPLQTLDLMTPIKDAFVKALFSTLPKELAQDARVHFCSPSGSDAVEAAIKLVKTATGRRGIIGCSGGYHGHTQGALAVMGNRAPKKAVVGLMGDVHFVPFPYAYRCPMGGSDSIEERCRAARTDRACGCAGFVCNLLHDTESGLPPIAGFILEPVQGEGGVIPAPAPWLREIAAIAQETSTPLILDEVQTGWGRTGTLYAFEHSGIVPDVVVLSKAIGGSLPLAVIVYRGALDVWPPGVHAGTFRGNQLAMAAGLATLRYLLDHDIPAHAAAMGDRFVAHLRELQRRHAVIGDVRGRGLMIGIEIVDPDDYDRTGRPAGDGVRARKVQAACFRNGLIVELGGRNGAVVRLLPPLDITPEQVDTVAAVIGRAFEETRTRVRALV